MPVRALALWLAENPTAVVGALGEDGLPVAMPPSVPLLPTHQVDGRSLLDLVAPEDTTSVVKAFVDALREGVSVTRVKAAGDTPRHLLVHYADVRDLYGVVLRAVLSDDGAPGCEPMRPSDLAAVRPRLAVIEKDTISTILAIDEATTAILGWSPEEMVGRPTLEFIHPDDQSRAIENWMQMVGSGVVHSVRTRLRRKDGGWVWMETSNALSSRPDGLRVVISRMIDISEEMAAAEALHRSERLLRRVTETVPVGLVELDTDLNVTYVNAAFYKLLGEYGITLPAGMLDLLPAFDRSLLRKAMQDALAAGSDSDLEVRLAGRRSLGDRLCRIAVRAIVDGDDVLGAVLCVMDVTDLKLQAETDPLTGLHNRSAVLGALRCALAGEAHIGVIFVDLDHFKLVNDRFGHDAGDQLLCHVADRLRSACREDDVPGRVGGDEFLVVLPNVGSEENLAEIASRFQEALRSHPGNFTWGPGCSASIGAAWVKAGSVTAAEAVAMADVAMYSAKRARNEKPVLWSADLLELAQEGIGAPA